MVPMRVEARAGRTRTARGCRARRRRRAASGRSRPPRGCRRTCCTTSAGPVDVLVRRDRRQEVPRVRQAVGADRAELGQVEGLRRSSRRRSRAPSRRAARRGSGRRAGSARRSPGSHLERARTRCEQQPAALRDDQQLAVGVDEAPGRSSSGWRVQVDRRCRLRASTSPLPPSGPQPVDEVGAARRAPAAGPSAAGSGRASLV